MTDRDGPKAQARSTPEGGVAELTSPAFVAFGKYQLFASLGRGGMADVYLAVARGPLGFRKLSVVKQVRAQHAANPQFVELFLDEARLSARLNHPNIVHTYEVGEHDGAYFIAMEYLAGVSLDRVLRRMRKERRPLDEGFCLRVVTDALSGLEHAHTLRDYDGSPLGIVHRDVSPHNVLVTYDGHTKLCDFGLAKAKHAQSVTEVGVLKGKVAYMSPEQATSGQVDARSDVFAMGLVLWELLVGEPLLSASSAGHTLEKLVSAPIPRVSTRRPVDSALDGLVARALERRPEDRFASAGEMRDALEGILLRRPYRHTDVARVLAEGFRDAREQVEQKISAHMGMIEAAHEGSERRVKAKDAALPPTTQLSRLSESLSGVSTVSSIAAIPRGPVESVPLRAPPRSSVLPWVLGLVLLGVVAVTAVVVALVPPSSAPRGGRAP